MQKSFGRRRGLMTSVAALVAGTALPAGAVDVEAAVAPVRQLVAALLGIMKAGPGTSFNQRFDMLAPVIDRTFDLATVLHESIGPSWEMLPPEQQQMLLQAFRRYTVATYVNSFNTFNGQQFDVNATPRPVGNGEQIVQTQIIPTSGDSHELDYVMRPINGGWRAVDVLADGAISRVAVQRSDFRRLMNRGGPTALAQSLSSKSMDLSDGSS
jgi:phospholipid transport system substrate-binding protein